MLSSPGPSPSKIPPTVTSTLPRRTESPTEIFRRSASRRPTSAPFPSAFQPVRSPEIAESPSTDVTVAGSTPWIVTRSMLLRHAFT